MNDLAIIEKDTKALEVQAKGIKITDATTYQMAADILKTVKLQEDAIHEALDPEVDAAHKAHKALTAKRKTYLDPLDAIKAIVKKALVDWDNEQEKIRKEAERKALQEAEEKKSLLVDLGLEEQAVAVVAEVPQEKPVVQGVSYRETWDFTVEDENLIPRKFLSVDLAKIRGVVTALKSEADIPGVKVFVKKTAVSR